MTRRWPHDIIVLFCYLLLLAVCPDWCFSQQRRIYIANDDHTDYMWAADEDGYRVAFLAMLDYYLDLADLTDSLTSDFQSRFNTDGSFWLWTYQKNKSPQEFQRLINRIRDGHITVPLQTLIMVYGCMPAEAVLRSMYYAGRIERQYNLRFELVSAMENQTLPFGLPSLWAGAGAKYSWKGVCGCYTSITGLTNRGREIYYAQGPDGRSVLMKWHSLYGGTSYGGNQNSGGYAENREIGPAAMVDFVTSDPTFLARYPYPTVVGIFGWGWDDLQTTTNRFITAAQNKSDVSRRVIVSNEVDFFRDYVASAPSNVTPTFSAGFGNDWETNCATMAEVTAGVKRSVENLRSAEALATLVSLVDPGFVAPKTSSRDSAFINMGLYFEHNWNNDGAYSPLRPAFNRAKAAQIGNYVDGLKNDASADLARHIKHTGGEKFFVFNPLGWRRTDIADLPTTVTIQFRVVDVSTGTEVPSQVVTITGQQYVRILAQDIPSVGYRIYEIQRVASQLTDSAAVISPGNSTVENDKYRVTINGAGAISSLIDKRNGNREWVWDMMNDLGSGSGLPVPENVGSVSATLFVDAGGTLAHRTRVTLYRDIDRIDIENEITQNFFGDPPLSYSFGFNIAGYTVHHEEIGAIATAKLTSQGGSYSPTCARYEYLTLNHFVDISDATEGMTLSNWDSPFFQLGNSSVSTLDVSTPRIKAMVGGRAAPDTRGFGGQDGDTYFKNRYSLRRHDAYDQAGVMRMALEHQNPLVAEKLTGNADGPFPESNYSLLTVSDSNIVLWALKPAEEGITDVENGGIIVRAWNLAENTRAFHLTVNGTLTAALKTTHIETNLTNVAVSGSTISDTLPSQWMQTYRLYASLVPTAVQERPGSQPKSTRLFHNFPNPFNPKTTISFELDSPSHVRLTVYDLLGREVNTLVNEELGTGKHVYSLDAGRLGLGSGIYFYRLQATPDGGNVLATIGNFVDTKSMILLK